MSDTDFALDAYGGWKSALTRLSEGEDLTIDQAHAAMQDILSDRAGPVRMAGLLMAMKTKDEADEELQGFAQAMLQAAEPLDLPPDTLDIVGTGGSTHRQRHALNVSTMASFVAAGAGATVCKHGSVAASSTSGSFDFLSALGLDIDISPQALQDQVRTIGLGFAFAKTFHPAMRFAGPVRSDLGIQTIFNFLGPLAHPGAVQRQIVGASTEQRAHQLARVLHNRGMTKAWVVCGEGGFDELTTTGPTVVFEATDRWVSRFVVTPEEAGVERSTMDDLAGGTAADNVDRFNALLKGEAGPIREIVLLNAGAGLFVSGTAASLEEGVAAARAAIDSGAVAQKVAQLAT